MPTIHFITPEGQSRAIEATAGNSIMQTAIDNNIDGIVGDCGGFMTCATCHIHVQQPWAGKLAAPNDDELAMLEFVQDPGDTSRLACQIKLDPELDGITVRIPEKQG